MTDHNGFPLTARDRAPHARIAGAAADLIYCRGLGSTTLRDVRDAAAANGSQMTHYFSDKHALVRGRPGLRARTARTCPVGPNRFGPVLIPRA